MTTQSERQAWIATLAKAEPEQLEGLVNQLGTLPEYSFLRPPEIGLAMVRGRIGGTGGLFNLGEMTLTRCVIQLEKNSGSNTIIVGYGYVPGRSRRHAELAALCDALLQCPQWSELIKLRIIESLEQIRQQQQTNQQRQTVATKVNFFTLIRGEG